MAPWPPMLVAAIFERHAPDLTPHFSPSRRSISEKDEEWYEVEAITDHRYVESNLEYLIAWKPAHDGTAYEPSWEPAAFANASLRRSYHSLASLPPIIVSADVRPLIGRALRAVWAAVTLAKTRARPRVHEVLLPEISLPELGDAFLAAVASPWLLRGGAATGDRVVPTAILMDCCRPYPVSSCGVGRRSVWRLHAIAV